MIRFFFRFLGFWALAAGAVFFVMDAARSIAASAWNSTPLGLSWFEFSPGTLNLSQALIQRYLHPVIWDPGVQTVLLAPTFLVFLGLGLLLMLVGRRRPDKMMTTLTA